MRQSRAAPLPKADPSAGAPAPTPLGDDEAIRISTGAALPEGHAFWKHPKITITPHTSARTLRDETIEQIAGKIRRLERGEPIAGVVDRERGY